MDADRTKRAHAIFTDVLALPRPDRDAAIDSACADDPAIRTLVMRLLSAADRAADFLERPALARERDTAPAKPDTVGNYLVVGVLGVGGMATVYEAIQDNPNRRVALKVMHQSLTATGAAERFAFECQTLARLHHPGIAQIYEAGTAPIGQPTPSPFFAMELIPDAVSITDYAESRVLPVRERVAMLAAVCDAVQHGHQRGVIHRDIKPANVLVDPEGRPKVIDFGVARATESGAPSLTRLSDARQVIGSLNSMSPEQCSPGGEVDARTDVYALGVLLYELLSGRPPHDLSGKPLPAALASIIQEPPRPLESRLQGVDHDLEAIANKAMQKDPDHRYDSASALASDLRRWLQHQPTEARPPGMLTLFRLFARRNRGLVIAGSAVAASIVLIATISTSFAVRLNAEVGRRRAAERQTAIERDQVRWQAYTAQIAGALAALKTGEFQQMRSRISAADTPRRGWEWGFLQRLSERGDRAVTAHADMIISMAVDPAWSTVLTSAQDGSVRLWNATDLSLKASEQSESGARTLAAAFLPGGRSVVVGNDDGGVRILNAADLQVTEDLARLDANVRSVAALPDGRIAAATGAGKLYLWSGSPRVESVADPDQPGGIRGIEVAFDGSLLATYNDDGHIWVRRTGDLTVVNRFTFPGSVRQARFSRDSRLLVAAGGSGKVLTWQLPENRLLHEIEVTGGVNTVGSVAISNDSTILAAGLIHRGIVICSIAQGRVIGEIGGHSEAVSGLSFSPDDAHLLSASWDRSIRYWRPSDFSTSTGGVVLAGHATHVLGIAFSPDGSTLVSAARDATMRLWDPDTAEQITTFSKGKSALNAVDMAPDGRRLVTGSADGAVDIWDTSTGEVLLTLGGSERGVAAVAFSPQGDRVAAGANDGTVRVWNAISGTQELLLAGAKARVNSVRFSPDGSLIAAGSRDKSVRVWSAKTGEERFARSEHESDVFAVLFNSAGDRLYSGSRDQSVRVWDVRSGNCLNVLAGHGQYVTSLALNPDSTRLAAGSWYGEIVLFDVETSDLIASFRAHESAIRAVAFSPDGRWLASASYDGTVRLLDSASRSAAESARGKAIADRDAARKALARAIDPNAASAAEAFPQVISAGFDPRTEPWIRKALLSRFARTPESPVSRQSP